MGTASPMGWSPDRTGKADRFRELIVSFLASRERKFLLDSRHEVIGWGNPLQCSCLENPRDREAWWAAVYGVTQSRTRLKWLSSSSSIGCLLERASLLSWESGSLLPTIRWLLARFQRGSVSFGGDLDSGLHFCGLGARPHTCGLGGRTQQRCLLSFWYEYNFPIPLKGTSGD